MGFDFALNLPQFNNDEYDPEKIRALVDELERMYSAVIAEGAQSSIVTVITTSYSSGRETVILVDDDTAAGIVTINLPPAAAVVNKVYNIKKLGTTGNVVLDPDGSELIDGAATSTMTTQYDSLHIIGDGVGWHIL